MYYCGLLRFYPPPIIARRGIVGHTIDRCINKEKSVLLHGRSIIVDNHVRL